MLFRSSSRVEPLTEAGSGKDDAPIAPTAARLPLIKDLRDRLLAIFIGSPRMLLISKQSGVLIAYGYHGLFRPTPVSNPGSGAGAEIQVCTEYRV